MAAAADERWMQAAIGLAREAAASGEVPVGALVVHEDRVIGRGSNQREAWQDPTAHAELLALREAAKELGSWRLEGCDLYVTLEPCPMCAGALVNARVRRLVYGAVDPKAGAVETFYRIPTDARLNHRLEVTGGVLAEDCGQLLTAFFASLRRRKVAKRCGDY